MDITRSAEDKASFASLLVAGVGLSVLGLVVGFALCLRLIPLLTQACLAVCSVYPPLMQYMGGQVTPVTVVVFGLLPLPFLIGGIALAAQLRATRRLIRPLRETRSVLPSKLRRAAKRVGLDLNRLEYVREGNVFALCHGFLSPRICVSRGLVRRMSREELEAVLLHESYHLLQRDPLRMLVSRSLSYALFFLPIARYLADKYLVHREIAADAWALKRVDRGVMARAFLRMIESPAGFYQPGLAAVGLLNVTGERIRLLLHPEHAPDSGLPLVKLAISILVAALLFAGTGAVLLNPAQAASDQGTACAQRHPGACHGARGLPSDI